MLQISMQYLDIGSVEPTTLWFFFISHSWHNLGPLPRLDYLTFGNCHVRYVIKENETYIYIFLIFRNCTFHIRKKWQKIVHVIWMLHIENSKTFHKKEKENWQTSKKPNENENKKPDKIILICTSLSFEWPLYESNNRSVHSCQESFCITTSISL